ncbi:hypothetical protein [Nocardioides caricicola]|uniref:Uncharacterized protein n=1 Tax=Nocardioides caricicola TaxID=634770 RepID=A0ABW0MVS9_9ACTN
MQSTVVDAVKREIVDYATAGLNRLLEVDEGRYVIKYVPSAWAMQYTVSGRLKVSQTPALTWGTGTYVSPILHPLSTALYGRCGLVARADDAPAWRVFDARKASAQAAYVNWVRSQPIFHDLVLTVHATYTNHFLRDLFRATFQIDCVLFRPDQAADLHTDTLNDTWLLVTDWDSHGGIDPTFSTRLRDARFSVLLDEEFDLLEDGLPIRAADRKLEAATVRRLSRHGTPVAHARADLPQLSLDIVNQYVQDGFVHVYIEP